MTRRRQRIRTEPMIGFGITDFGGGFAIPSMGSQWFASSEHADAFGSGDAFDRPLATAQAAINAAGARDMIFLAPGNYDEAVTITSRDDLVIVGAGGRGNIAVAPAATNAKALTVTGTSADRAQDLTLVNVGLEGNGTGGGLHVTGNIRRVRLVNCKLEGGAFAVKFESTAAGSVGDVRIDDCELAWATDGLILTASGGGDPVTNLIMRNSLIHNITTDCVRGDVSHHTNIQIVDNVFDGSEAGTEPTQFIDLNVASTTGIVCGNRFRTTVFSTAKFAIAAGVLFVGNFAEAESGSGAASGTAGRPD